MAKLAALTLLLLALTLVAASSADASRWRHRPKYHHHHKKPSYYCQWKGSVCHDPVLVGADGQQFYFHGHRDADFCLVSDSNLHINAHFIGLRRPGMPRDFTWVQSLGILFGSHQLYVGAKRVGAWDDGVDQLALALDDAPVAVPEVEDAAFRHAAAGVTVARLADRNSVAVEVEGQFRLLAKVVPVTAAEDAKQGYGIPFAHDCFAHLELNFQFSGLSTRVAGVLGRTYTAQYKALEKKAGQLMPTLGGDAQFQTSHLMATDCQVSRFGTAAASDILADLSPVSCASGSTGVGMVCRR